MYFITLLCLKIWTNTQTNKQKLNNTFMWIRRYIQSIFMIIVYSMTLQITLHNPALLSISKQHKTT